jgi:dCMP deaminase
MTRCLVAYIPVLHEGYRRLLERHAAGGRMFVVGPELYEDYRPLAKDIRALPAELTARAIAAWGLCGEVSVLDVAGAERLAGEAPAITMPAEDVSYRLAERFFPRCEVSFDTAFLRWDKTKTAQLLRPQPRVTVSRGEPLAELGHRTGGGEPLAEPRHATDGGDELIAMLGRAAEEAAAGSVDWWRQVGAAMRLAGGELRSATNIHNPHPLSAYAAGDPRANLHRGVGLELSTATHAEARLIAQAARAGEATEGAVMYVTDFPCPPCAKLIAAAGIARLYYVEGYAVLDGQDVLEAAGVEIVRVA